MAARGLLAAIFFISLANCASTPSLSSENASRLSAVRIDQVIDTPKTMYYLGPGSGVGMMFGAVGGAITAVANMSPGEHLNQFAKDNGIQIDQIVKEEAISAFQKAGKLKIVDAPDPSATTMKIAIVTYGFSIPTGFSDKLVPMVSVRCTLTDATGKVLWSAKKGTMPLGNPAEAKTPDELHADPALIDTEWRIAARSVMTDIAGHM